MNKIILLAIPFLGIVFLGINWVFGQTLLDDMKLEQEMENSTLKTQSEDTLKMVQDYCFAHTDQILSAKNPINDLVNSGLVPSYAFNGTSCDLVNKQIQVNLSIKRHNEDRQKVMDSFNEDD
jgi:hypothetical protein